MENISQLTKAEEDFKYATRYVKPFLVLIGAWPVSPSSSFSSRILLRIRNVLSYFLLLLLIVPPFLHMFLKRNSVKVILRIVGPTFNSIMQFCKYTFLLGQVNRIQKSLNAIKEDLTSATEENRLIFRSKVKIQRRIVVIAAITMYGGGFCHRAVVPLLRGTIVTPDNVTIKLLPAHSYLVILDEQKSPTYEILFVLQVLAGFVSYAIVCGISGMSALLVLHTCSMLRILANKMNRLVDKKDVPEMMVQRRIADIVEYQVKIKR